MKLLFCPFCGAKPAHGGPAIIGERVECQVCGAVGPKNPPLSPVINWNTRGGYVLTGEPQ